MELDNSGYCYPRRCLLDAFAPPGADWIVNINGDPLNMSYLRSEQIWDRNPPPMPPCDHNMSKRDNIKLSDLIIIQAMDEKPRELFDYIVRECVAAPYFITCLAQHLSGKSVAIMCRKVFTGNDLNENFVENFYTMFFPAYFKRKYSWFTVHLLKQAQTSWPGAFKNLLRVLIKNVEVPRRVLQDFVVNIKETQRDNFMKTIVEAGLNTEQFVHHLQTINLVFVHSDKNVHVCRFVLDNLESHAYDCYNNREYGRLLLSLLKNLGETDISQRTIKNLIDIHGTEYKAPCLIAFEEIIENMIAMQHQNHQGSRFFIERPVEIGYRVP